MYYSKPIYSVMGKPQSIYVLLCSNMKNVGTWTERNLTLLIFSFQQSQGGGIVLRVEEKARAGVVWGNKQNPTIRTQRNSTNSISDSIYSSAQDGGIKNTIPTESKESPISDCNTISSK